MRTILTAVLGVVIGSLLAGGIYYYFRVYRQPERPQPHYEQHADFHEHVDLLISVNGNQIDLSQDKYKSTSENFKDPQIHLHDNNGAVVHLHRAGVTLGKFLESIGMSLTMDCLTTDDGSSYCSNEQVLLQTYVNGQLVGDAASYGFKDLDRVLIYYGPENSELKNQLLSKVTDQSCIYSKKCPERGEPPTENCVADPNVPCTL